MSRNTVEREMYWEDFYRLFVTDADGRRIVIVCGRTDKEAEAKLRKFPVAVQRWIVSFGPIIHERRDWTPGVDFVREVGRIAVTVDG